MTDKQSREKHTMSCSFWMCLLLENPGWCKCKPKVLIQTLGRKALRGRDVLEEKQSCLKQGGLKWNTAFLVCYEIFWMEENCPSPPVLFHLGVLQVCPTLFFSCWSAAWTYFFLCSYLDGCCWNWVTRTYSDHLCLKAWIQFKAAGCLSQLFIFHMVRWVH